MENKSENKKIAELEMQLAAMQEEIGRLKQTGEEIKEKAPDPYLIYEERIKTAQKELHDIFLEMNKEYGVLYASTSVGMAQARGVAVTGCGSTVSNDFASFPEEGIAVALDVFTHPGRINILKFLMSGDATASQISHKTGLVGGQLYHHLSILENAKFIHKHGNAHDGYYIDSSAQLLLGGIYATIGGMEIARG